MLKRFFRFLSTTVLFWEPIGIISFFIACTRALTASAEAYTDKADTKSHEEFEQF